MAVNYPELWQFRFSMYPEKARWALDYKSVPHVRRSLLPGPHALTLMPRFGQKTMPILCHDGRVLKNSGTVLDYVERTWPDPPLYPVDPQQRAQALEIQKWFDDIGPALRRAAFFEWLPHTEYAARVFAMGFAEWQQKVYAFAFPCVRAVMRMDMHIGANGAETGRELTKEALDFVVRHATKTGYLVGNRFSIADLTAATVLQPTCLPPEYPALAPEPRPAGWQHWLKRWQDHPGLDYVRRMYRDHRGQSCAVSE
ncbi:glutathione S-transferase family protein [Pendulispora brunnea]|uniref:Glutathione S-transferase family protein n=1 Tax=Pendulispora brunnea TaxID=2905690 RepID=A0ABZ2KFI5_9BACT